MSTLDQLDMPSVLFGVGVAAAFIGLILALAWRPNEHR